MPTIEIINHCGKKVLVTTAWTKRTYTITGETPRSATITRPLGVSSWGVSFTSDAGKVLTLPEICPDYDLALDRAIRFVALGQHPTPKHFRAISKVKKSINGKRQTQEQLVMEIASEIGIIKRRRRKSIKSYVSTDTTTMIDKAPIGTV